MGWPRVVGGALSMRLYPTFLPLQRGGNDKKNRTGLTHPFILSTNEETHQDFEAEKNIGNRYDLTYKACMVFQFRGDHCDATRSIPKS